MNIIQKSSTVNTTACPKRVIEYIVIHYTAGISSSGKSDENTAAWFSRLTAKASSDYIVDDDSVTQFNADPRNRYTWHCGGARYSTKGGSLYGKCTNANSIGIEVCSSNSSKKVQGANDPTWYFTDETVENAVELTRLLMAEYGIPPEKVVRHYDVTGKLCPGIVGWNLDSGDESKWEAFKGAIASKGCEGATGVPQSGYDELLARYSALEREYAGVVKERDMYKETLSQIRGLCG